MKTLFSLSLAALVAAQLVAYGADRSNRHPKLPKDKRLAISASARTEQPIPNRATSIATDAQKNVYVIDNFDNGRSWAIHKYSSDGTLICDVTNPDLFYSLPKLTAVAVDKRNGVVYFGNAGKSPYQDDRLWKATPNTSGNSYYIQPFGPKGDWNPTGIAVDNNGYVYVADYKTDARGSIQKIDPQTEKATLVAVNVRNATGAAVDSKSNVYWSVGASSLWRAKPSASGYTVEEIRNTGLPNVSSFAVDAEGTIFAAETVTNFVHKYSSSDGSRQPLAAGFGALGSELQGTLDGIAVDGNKLYFTGGNKVFVANTSPSPLFSDPREFRKLACSVSSGDQLAKEVYLANLYEVFKYDSSCEQLSAFVNSRPSQILAITATKDGRVIYSNTEKVAVLSRDGQPIKTFQPDSVRGSRLVGFNEEAGTIFLQRDKTLYGVKKPYSNFGLLNPDWFSITDIGTGARGITASNYSIYVTFKDCVGLIEPPKEAFGPFRFDKNLITGLSDSHGLAVDNKARVYLGDGAGVYYAHGRNKRFGIADIVGTVKDVVLANENIIYALVRCDDLDSVWQFPIEPTTFVTVSQTTRLGRSLTR